MRKAQSLIEYSILIVIIAAAFMTMQVYIKRGFQGRWKQAADDMGDQYDMKAFTSDVRYTLTATSNSTATAKPGNSSSGEEGMITYREDSSVSTETKKGTSHIEPTGL